MAPTILLVPGFWEGPEAFEALSSQLTSSGYTVLTAKFLSTGTVSPGNPSMSDDIAGIRKQIEVVVDKNDDVVLVLHSAGGFIGSNAMEGLSIKARKEKGQQGGVRGIVFISGAVFPEGFQHGPLPFAVAKDGDLQPVEPAKLFFNDLEPTEASKWVSKLHSQPAEGWDGTVTHTGWQHVPSVYIVCTKDAALPEALQMQLAASAGSKIEKVEAGHMAQISKPAEVASLIDQAAKTF